MWQTGRAGGPGVLARGGVAVIVAALLAGCGGSLTGPKPPDHLGRPALTVAPSGPRGGSGAQAAALGQHVLASLVLPAGSHVTNVPLVGQLRQPAGMLGSGSLADVHRLFSLGLPMRQAARFLRTHTPPGMRRGGGGEVSVATAAVQTLSDTLRSPPRGIYLAQVAETVVPAAGGRSLLRADAQVIWYPSRTAAEHTDPADYGAVTLKTRVLLSSNREVTRRFTAKSVIARLAAILNGMEAAPNLAIPCPIGPTIDQARFAATARGQPSLQVVTGGCGVLEITTGGRGQPGLLDSGGRFTTAVHQLLGLRHIP